MRKNTIASSYLDYSLPVAYLMKKVIVIFPDSVTMADFVIMHGISNAEVNSRELTLTAFLTEEQIVIASTRYEAIVQSMFTTRQ